MLNMSQNKMLKLIAENVKVYCQFDYNQKHFQLSSSP